MESFELFVLIFEDREMKTKVLKQNLFLFRNDILLKKER